MVKEMPEVKLSRSERFLRNIIQHYNEEKYWRYRENVINGGDCLSVEIVVHQEM